MWLSQPFDCSGLQSPIGKIQYSQFHGLAHSQGSLGDPHLVQRLGGHLVFGLLAIRGRVFGSIPNPDRKSIGSYLVEPF